jgi:hypothetical protein
LNKDDKYPQEFTRVVSEYRTLYWDAVHSDDVTTDQGRQAVATLYNTATLVWGDVRIPLPSKFHGNSCSVQFQCFFCT